MEGNAAKRLVADGYDRIARSYLDLVESMDPSVRTKYLDVLTRGVPAGAAVLELGCGAGEPMTRVLSGRFRVIGLEIAPNQLALARANAPRAALLRGDMVRLPFRDECFDAVAAFYSMTHVPRAEHLSLLGDVARVLRSGALLVITAGSSDTPDWHEKDWLGAPTFFSHYDGATNTRLVAQAGFEVISSEDEHEMERDQPACFRWIVGQKNAS
jgi:ubiquinone/menaquinone biosynthesis C-methylase UbiE